MFIFILFFVLLCSCAMFFFFGCVVLKVYFMLTLICHLGCVFNDCCAFSGVGQCVADVVYPMPISLVVPQLTLNEVLIKPSSVLHKEEVY